MIMLVAVILAIPIICWVAYAVHRRSLGFSIGMHMRIFSDRYDANLANGWSKERALLESITVFKNCSPFNKISSEEWEKIHRAFARLDDPKSAFLKLVMAPAWKVVKLLRDPEFLESIYSIKDKGGIRRI